MNKSDLERRLQDEFCGVKAMEPEDEKKVDRTWNVNRATLEGYERPYMYIELKTPEGATETCLILPAHQPAPPAVGRNRIWVREGLDCACHQLGFYCTLIFPRPKPPAAEEVLQRFGRIVADNADRLWVSQVLEMVNVCFHVGCSNMREEARQRGYC